MCRQIVHHDDVAGIESGCQHLFDISEESDGVHRSVERHRRGQGGAAQGGGKGRGQPMTMRLRAATSAAFRTAVKPRYLGRGAGLVDEDQLVGIKLRREYAPGLARTLNIGSILLGCVRAFFEGYAVTVEEAPN